MSRLGGFAAGEPPGLSWLGGAAGQPGWLMAYPDREIAGDEAARLDEVAQAWEDDRARRAEAVWCGVLGYELGVARLLGRARAEGTPGLPALLFRRYPAALRLRGDDIEAQVGEAAAAGRLRDAVASAQPRDPGAWPLGSLVAGVDPAVHRARVREALRAIAAGETYQINLSQPMHARWASPVNKGEAGVWGRCVDLFEHLRARYPAPMGGLVAVPGGAVVSNSPEVLLDLDRTTRRATSLPIKGTRPRGEDPTQDAAQADALRRSDKDAAEHVMIVDLVRNDLGRLARVGSVRAPARPTLVTLPTVHHLVTEVSATLRGDVGLTELVDAMFPGGSITGAPKRRTVELIETLEDHRRGVYCGSIVVMTPQRITMSIAIRTGYADASGLTLCSGGGIVADSDPEAERLETLAKARAFSGG